MKLATLLITPSSPYMSSSIFKYTTMGPIIAKNFVEVDVAPALAKITGARNLGHWISVIENA